MTNDDWINKKGKIGQFFCKHKNSNWYVKNEPFQTLSGERQYKYCLDCGKQLDERFVGHN